MIFNNLCKNALNCKSWRAGMNLSTVDFSQYVLNLYYDSNSMSNTRRERVIETKTNIILVKVMVL